MLRNSIMSFSVRNKIKKQILNCLIYNKISSTKRKCHLRVTYLISENIRINKDKISIKSKFIFKK